MSEQQPEYTATIPGKYNLTHVEDIESKRYRLLQLRRHLIGTLRHVEHQLGMEQSIPERKR